MMAWPKTENVGFETVGLGRGWMECLSRKWASYLDMIGFLGVVVSRQSWILTLDTVSRSIDLRDCTR